MISVAEALDRLFALAVPPGTEDVALTAAAGRVLAADAVARRDQPPFAASAMDGYAVAAADARPGAVLRVTGESAAGRGWAGGLAAGEAIRIFTGAPVPQGTGMVVLQEDVTRDGDRITLGNRLGEGTNIRPAGGDFASGMRLAAPRRLRPADIALLAAMNVARVTVARAPDVAIIATGDELVPPGGDPGPDQIIASNAYGLHALLRAEGARPRLLPIAADRMESLAQAFALAGDADLILTIGGASVGDHDLVADAARAAGMEMAFHKVAMRPGKPLMAGGMGARRLLGLPGNPVSAMICGTVFLAPLIRAMQGLPARPMAREAMPLAAALGPNGPREHYLRAAIGPDGVTPLPRQDSSLLTVLAGADALIVQPPLDPGRPEGAPVDVIRL